MSSVNLEPAVTTRECTGIQVPSGTLVTMPARSMVQITQALGGSYTVNFNGNLVRIDSADADVIGKKPVTMEFQPSSDNKIQEEHIWQVLKSCYDPEIPVNIVDLGLIYDCTIDTSSTTKQEVLITMTLTAPGCGMGEVLVAELEQKLLKVPHVDKVKVDLTFDPPWDRSKLSDAAKLELGLF